jgi:hypothetical protein
MLTGISAGRATPQVPQGWGEPPSSRVAGGSLPSGSLRSRRDSLPSPGSCHRDHQDAGTHAQWAKSLRSWLVIPRQATLAFFMGRSRLCLLRSQRTR